LLIINYSPHARYKLMLIEAYIFKQQIQLINPNLLKPPKYNIHANMYLIINSVYQKKSTFNRSNSIY